MPIRKRSANINTQYIGTQSETVACRYLQQQGLHLITRNFTSRFGEIDLIMQDERCLVFIEVRYRQRHCFGGALESVTPLKQRRLIKTALAYLQVHPRWQGSPMRFDVVGLDGDNNTVGQWVRNAFFADDF